MDKRISVVMTVYNNEKFVVDALMSVLHQSISNELEIIVVDDASTDRSDVLLAGIAANYPESVRVVTLCQNVGAGAARRRGLSECTCEYVATIDSDDWIDEDHFERLLRVADERRADIVVGGIVHHFDDGSVVMKVPAYSEKKGSEAIRGYLNSKTLFVNNMLVRREIAVAEPYSMRRYVEDTPTALRWLWAAGRVVYVDAATYHYRQNTDSLCHRSSVWKTHLYCGLCAVDMADYFCERDEFTAQKMAVEAGKYLRLVFNSRMEAADVSENLRELAEFIVKSSKWVEVVETGLKK